MSPNASVSESVNGIATDCCMAFVTLSYTPKLIEGSNAAGLPLIQSKNKVSVTSKVFGLRYFTVISPPTMWVAFEERANEQKKIKRRNVFWILFFIGERN